jgi:hypothetical protein
MNGILDSMLKNSQAFGPESVTGYIAFQLARRFDDTHHIPKYLLILEHQPLPIILEALTNAMTGATNVDDRRTIFEQELLRLSGKDVDYAP